MTNTDTRCYFWLIDEYTVNGGNEPGELDDSEMLDWAERLEAACTAVEPDDVSIAVRPARPNEETGVYRLDDADGLTRIDDDEEDLELNGLVGAAADRAFSGASE